MEGGGEEGEGETEGDIADHVFQYRHFSCRDWCSNWSTLYE